jgi:hypothetical protein
MIIITCLLLLISIVLILIPDIFTEYPQWLKYFIFALAALCLLGFVFLLSGEGRPIGKWLFLIGCGLAFPLGAIGIIGYLIASTAKESDVFFEKYSISRNQPVIKSFTQESKPGSLTFIFVGATIIFGLLTGSGLLLGTGIVMVYIGIRQIITEEKIYLYADYIAKQTLLGNVIRYPLKCFQKNEELTVKNKIIPILHFDINGKNKKFDIANYKPEEEKEIVQALQEFKNN